MKKDFWDLGEKSRLASAIGISLSHMSDILHRRKGVGFPRAMKLSLLTKQVLRKDIPFYEWVSNRVTKHPAFYGKPKKIKNIKNI